MLYVFDEITARGGGAIFRKRSVLLPGLETISRTSEAIRIAMKQSPRGYGMYLLQFAGEIGPIELRRAYWALNLD
jgi:hypothetical protein